MSNPTSPPSSFVAGRNPRISQSGSFPVAATPPPLQLSTTPLSSPNGSLRIVSPRTADIEAQIETQRIQLAAQQALLEQQQAMIRQQQEEMALRQKYLEEERLRILQAQFQASMIGTPPNSPGGVAFSPPSFYSPNLPLSSPSTPHLTATAANGAIHTPQTAVSANSATGDDEGPTSYFGNGGMDYGEGETVEDIPPPPTSDNSDAPTTVHRLSLTPMSEASPGSLSSSPATHFPPLQLHTRAYSHQEPTSPHQAVQASHTRTQSSDSLNSSPLTSPSSSSASSLAATSKPMSIGPGFALSSMGSSSPSLSVASTSSNSNSPRSLTSVSTPALSSSAPSTSSMHMSLSASSEIAMMGQNAEGGMMRPDDLTTFVPIVPVKKDYSAQNAIKDKVIDDLVMFSRNFQIIIKGGTLNKLIERLTFESTTDNDYIDTFLLTYRTFISPLDLLEQLLERYRTGSADINPEGISEIEASNAEKKQKIIRIRVGNVLKRWLSDHYHDYHDPAMLSRLESGVADIHEAQLQATLKKTIQEQQLHKNKIRDLMFSKEKPAPILPKGPTFDDWDVVEVARQLCLLEQTIYQQIHPKEALNQAWNKHKERAPNIIRMIAFFNRMSKWVSTQICQRDDFKARVKLIIKFMQLTVALRQNNNFDCMQAVLSGLNNSSVFRMKASWAKIQKEKFYATWKQMATDITDTTNNSHNYRQAVSTADPPIIPYLGVYLTDLTFTEDGNADYLRVQGGQEDIVNFEKMRRVAVVIKDICTYQQTPYNFERVPQIYDFFAGDLPFEDDNSLFKRSRALEPPDTNNPGQVISPKKAKKSISFRRVSLGIFSTSGDDASSSAPHSPKDKDKKKEKDKDKSKFVKSKE